MTAKPVRLTANTAKVLEAFLRDPTQAQYGYDLTARLGLTTGQLYPVLARLEAAGWIEGRREDIDPAVAGRPARRYYTLIPPRWLASAR